jgi:hypothetical protein
VPTHPIYLPITPPPDSGLAPTHPIYVPVYPAHPIYPADIEEIKQKVKDFLFGQLPPSAGPQKK